VEVSRQLHDTAALPPEKKEKRTGPHRTGCRVYAIASGRFEKREKSFVPAGIQSPERPARSVVAVPTTTSRLQQQQQTFAIHRKAQHQGTGDNSTHTNVKYTILNMAQNITAKLFTSETRFLKSVTVNTLHKGN
jgi:hypothetical protein